MAGRGRGRAAAALLVAMVGLTGPLACAGSDADADGPTTSTAPTGDPTRVPAAFALQADGWTVEGATDDLLVGLGGPPGDDDRFGQAFDLETGALTDIPPPPFDDDRPVQVDTAVFGSTSVTVDAYVYGPGIDADTVPVDSGYTPPTELLSYRLDPRAGTWERLTLPAGLEGAERLALWEIHAVGPDGAAGYFRTHGQEGTLATLDAGADGWEVVADGLPDRVAADFCATDTEWWQLETQVGTGIVSVLSLVTGESRPVETPPLLEDLVIGGSVGCSAERAVLAIHGSRETPTGLYVSRPDGSWDAGHEIVDVGQSFVEQVEDGGAAGPIVLVGDMGSDPVGEPPSVVFDHAGRPVPVTVDKGTEDLVWRGRTGSYLVIGPRDPADESEEPVGIRAVEVP